MASGKGVADHELRPIRNLTGAGAAVYLAWWFAVELLLPGSFNPLLGRLLVVGMGALLVVLSHTSRVVAQHLASLLAAWLCVVVGHYFYLVIGNHGDSTWWVGAFITVAAAGMCLHGPRALLVFSIFTMACVMATAAFEGQVAHSIYVPGLATILLLANAAKRSQAVAQQARLQAIIAGQERDRAEEANRFKSMFLGLVSHELLTPLQSIRLNSDALLRAAKQGAPERLDRVERISRGAQRLADLIESLLEHARIESGSFTVVEEPFDLVALASEVVDELAAQRDRDGKALEVTVKAQAAKCMVKSDPKLIRLVLVNLISNAMKYTDSGRIEVDLTTDASSHRLAVRDTGRGIAPGDHERIFESFTQSEPLQHKHVPGLGLGLALVKEMTAALGARLELASVVGSGSTFTLVLANHASPLA